MIVCSGSEAQLRYLAVAFLLTYGAIKKEELCGDTIKVSLEPHRDADAARQQAAINVAFGRSVLWAIPLDECQTWLVSLTAMSWKKEASSVN